MSHPPGPGTPYGRQPPQQPYGYPRQPPAQPGHGYPEQQPQPQPPYGYQPRAGRSFAAYPGGPEVMPSSAKAARAMLFVLGGLQILGGLLLLLGAAALKSVDDKDELAMPIGLVYVLGVLFLAFAVVSIGMGAKYRTGGDGTRVGSVVIGVLVALSCVVGMIGGGFVLLAPLALSVLLIVFAAKGETAAWFKRPGY